MALRQYAKTPCHTSAPGRPGPNMFISYRLSSGFLCTQGPHILQLCMGLSCFWRGLTPPDPPLFRTLHCSVDTHTHKDDRSLYTLFTR